MTDVPKEKRRRRGHGTGCLWEATIQACKQLFSHLPGIIARGAILQVSRQSNIIIKKRNKNKNSNNFLRWKKISSFLSNTRSDSLNSTEWHLWLTPHPTRTHRCMTSANNECEINSPISRKHHNYPGGDEAACHRICSDAAFKRQMIDFPFLFIPFFFFSPPWMYFRSLFSQFPSLWCHLMKFTRGSISPHPIATSPHHHHHHRLTALIRPVRCCSWRKPGAAALQCFRYALDGWWMMATRRVNR